MRVVLAGPSGLFRAGLRRMIAAGGLQVVAEADNPHALAAALEQERLDVALVDTGLSGQPPPELIRTLTADWPDVKVVLVADSGEEQLAIACLRAGAVGAVAKDAPSDELLAAIAAATAGGSYIAPRVARRLLETVRGPGWPDDSAASGHRLSERELQVLRLVAEGRANAEIASALFISVSTAKTHVASVIKKLGVENRVQAAVEGVRSGLV